MDFDINVIKNIAEEAGKAILKVYNTDFDVEYKKSESFDERVSPLTKADKDSNLIILKELEKYFPGIPILSEEGKEVLYEERKTWKLFWLVDSLDGTKEFVNRGGEFTVNIALVKNNKPILGVIYVPITETFYYADYSGAFKEVQDKEIMKLPLHQNKRDKIIIVASKSHLNKETQDFIDELRKENQVEFKSVGSSLKFCLVAEGSADIYPRLGPTSEWDTAAAHAIVNAAGKKVYQYGKDQELIYNKENLLNPPFIVK